VALLEAHGPEAVARRRDELELRHVADADARVARPEVDRVEERVAVRAADAPNLRQSVVCAEPEYIMRSRKRSSDALTWSGVTSAAT
jgi:hypothetical protein